MNSNLGVTETLALLDRLKGAVEDFAAREEQLNHDFRVRSAAEAKAFDAASKEQEAEQSDVLARAEAGFAARKSKCQSSFDQRKRRINEAHKRLHKSALEDVSAQEGGRKHRLQESAIEAERRRDADLAGAAAQLEQFNQRLAESSQSLSLLERRAYRAFRGFWKFRRLLSPSRQGPEPNLPADGQQLFEQLQQLEERAGAGLKRLRKMPLVWAKRLLPPVWLLLVVLGGSFAWTLPVLHPAGTPARAFPTRFDFCLLTLMVLRTIVHLCAKHQAAATATAVAADVASARRLLETGYRQAEPRLQQAKERIKLEFEETNRRLDQEWKQALKEAVNLRDLRPRQIDEKARRIARKNEQLYQARLEQMEHAHPEIIARLQREAQAKAKALDESRGAKLAKLQAEHRERWEALESEWKSCLQGISETVQQANAAAQQLFPDWQLGLWEHWTPPAEFKNAARFARLEVTLEKLCQATPKDPLLVEQASRLFAGRPALEPGKAGETPGVTGGTPAPLPSLSVPLVLTYPREGSLLFETTKTGEAEAFGAINNIIFRLLSTTPPGKLSFTIFDPVGLGQNFAGIMHLADYEGANINSRIWTQSAQFEEKLAELNEHMEKVIQMYLRNEYETIAEYNAQAGTIAEKYHFLVIASFPVNFSDTAARRLRNIAASGARCGVFTLIHWDQRHGLPQDFVPDELRKNSVCIVRTDRGFELANRRLPGTRLLLDSPPSPDFATQFLHRVGRTSKDSGRVEVPFAEVAPRNSSLWTEKTTEELRVPIGRSGATKLQYLAIGKGTRQHALIAGKTGSGKSTLFHVIITNLSLWCSPEQVEFYLVDFKKGVEFKCYASRGLPHARVVAIESDRAFGLSVLERVDAELRRRGDLFRQLGVQDLPGYKRAGGAEAIPRSLLLIDEFQEFFVEEDRISQSAAVLLDRIVRQGRAFGIHVLLGSQTLGGAYTLARATIGQMVIRIALQCNEADAYLIMDQDNPAPRLLSRPGEGIYNDTAGSIEGNSPFQTVWLSDGVRDSYLANVRERADECPGQYPGPFVFEGNAPADVKENAFLRALLEAGPRQPLGAPASVPAASGGGDRAGTDAGAPGAARIWLGAPNSIKGPTEAVFQRQSGNNLLMVGQNEEAALAILGVALVSVAAQYRVGDVRLVLLDSTAPGSPQRDFLDRVIKAIPHPITQSRSSDLSEIMTGLAADLKRRTAEDEAAAAPATFVFIHGLQNYKKLRPEDEFSFSTADPEAAANPAAVLQDLITEGPSHGFHVVATCDTYNNVGRFLPRKTLSEFALRVLFQMSASDSASLIDAPDAGTLGLHRALFYNDREGYLEIFRPYARPGNDWIEDVAGHLKRQHPVGADVRRV